MFDSPWISSVGPGGVGLAAAALAAIAPAILAAVALLLAVCLGALGVLALVRREDEGEYFAPAFISLFVAWVLWFGPSHVIAWVLAGLSALTLLASPLEAAGRLVRTILRLAGDILRDVWRSLTAAGLAACAAAGGVGIAAYQFLEWRDESDLWLVLATIGLLCAILAGAVYKLTDTTAWAEAVKTYWVGGVPQSVDAEVSRRSIEATRPRPFADA